MKQRFKEIYGYKFDKWFFRMGMVLILFVLFFSLIENDFSLAYKPYIHCPEGRNYCYNELYQTKYCEGLDWCNQELLPEGFEYGESPGIISEYSTELIILILLFMFLLNHFVHNRKYEVSKCCKK